VPHPSSSSTTSTKNPRKINSILTGCGSNLRTAAEVRFFSPSL
jgi:hypothetical protein